MAKLIYNVKEIFNDYLNEEYKYYNIPEYQRGYKWDKHLVKKLLDDINAFKTNGNEDKFYCLQNITIVEHKENQSYNVVDGQQRLTTLIVLLSYLDSGEIVNNKLRYAVRPDTDKFIKLHILNKNIKEEDWESFLSVEKSTEIEDYDHQDIYYLFTAYNTIKNWFKEKTENEILIFKKKLLEHAKLIVNKPNVENEQELFMNLNTGKVSLDGADLVRALLITNVAKTKLENDDLEDVKNIVRLNERRVRIGLELDEISAWWSQKEVKNYFNWLDKTEISSTETIDFNSKAYPIDLLYKLYLLKDGKKDILLGDFEVSNYIELYKNLISLHRTIKDWYQDCEIYHFVKFLITYVNISFDKIWNIWKEATDRKMFISRLKIKVKESIKEENIEALDDLNENWFDNEDLYKILILLDIIQIINSQTKNNKNKLPFLDANYFHKSSEDREHIFPQTPISQRDIEKPTKELKGKVEKYIDILKMISVDVSSIDVENVNWENSDNLTELKENINNKLIGVIAINSIGNICLLHEKPNRGYGNDFYTSKRHVIIKNTKDGEHIRPHTLNAFDKGFLKSPDNLDKWSNEDISANAIYIKEQITDFFNLKDNKNENK